MTHDEKKIHEQMLNQKFINQFERIFKCCFCFFMTSVLRNTCTVSKFKLNIFFLFGVCLSLAILYIVLNVLCILYSSCAIVIDTLITLQAVQLCDQ